MRLKTARSTTERSFISIGWYRSATSVLSIYSEYRFLKENLKSIGDESQYAGSMFKEFVAQVNTLSNQIEILNNRKSILSATIGEVFEPSVRKIVENLDRLLII